MIIPVNSFLVKMGVHNFNMTLKRPSFISDQIDISARKEHDIFAEVQYVYKHPEMAKLSHCGKQQCILLLRAIVILINIIGLVAFSIAKTRHGEVFVNLGTGFALIIIDLAALFGGYRLRKPYVLVILYLFETPSILTLFVISLLFLVRSRE